MSKNNIELADFCRQMVGSVYWFGTYGQIGNAKLLSECAKRYPNQYSKKRIDTAHSRGDFGKRVMDCSGLIKNYLMSKHGASMPPEYDAQYDLSANSFHTKATEKGSISTMPEIIGLGLWKNNHVGVYIGGGKVIEAKGFDYGVIESDLGSTAFTEWFKIPFIEYVDESVPEPTPEPEQPANPAQDDDGAYIVQSGDTLTKIANMWGESVANIARYNGIENPDLIIVGQKILKPESPDTWTGMICTKRDPLRVRNKPSFESDVVKLLPKGSTVEIQNVGKIDGNWYQLADGSGFVWSEYVQHV